MVHCCPAWRTVRLRPCSGYHRCTAVWQLDRSNGVLADTWMDLLLLHNEFAGEPYDDDSCTYTPLSTAATDRAARDSLSGPYSCAMRVRNSTVSPTVSAPCNKTAAAAAAALMVTIMLQHQQPYGQTQCSCRPVLHQDFFPAASTASPSTHQRTASAMLLMCYPNSTPELPKLICHLHSTPDLPTQHPRPTYTAPPTSPWPLLLCMP
jgi:hypothetical protein